MTFEASSSARDAVNLPAPPKRGQALFAAFSRLFEERRFSAAMGLVGLAGLWFLRRPYNGVVHDARIYMGRGLADLDPQGLGSDLVFRFDGQSSFSVFPRIVDALIPALGFANAAAVLTAIGLSLWLAALFVLAGRLAEGRGKWAIAVAVAASSGAYGAFHLLHYAEAFATPRPFAEAGVLAALAALLAGSKLRAAAFLTLAALFHPIMALAGVGAFFVYLCLEDRRWIYTGLVGAACILIAAMLGAPLLSRLVEPVDQNWLALLRLRSTYLFPLLWDETAWAQIAIYAATLGFVAVGASGAAARLFWSVLIACLGGLSLATIFGDLHPELLFVQAQLWRATWLLALFGTIAICICALRLWREGPASRLTLALFALAWLGLGGTDSVALCCIAIAHYRFRRALSDRITLIAGYCCWAVVAIAALGEIGAHLYSVVKAWREAPDGVFNLFQLLTSSDLPRMPVTTLVLIWAASNYSVPRRLFLGCAFALGALALATWNGGSEFNRALASNRHPAELERIVAAHPGEVLWLGENDAPWVWLGRANWASVVQGGGILFSHPLMESWSDRMLALLDVGWIDLSVFEPWRHRATATPFTDFAIEKILRICRRPDAPAWIIGAVKSPADLPEGFVGQVWRSPGKFVQRQDGRALEWEHIQDFAVIDCARYAGAAAR